MITSLINRQVEAVEAIVERFCKEFGCEYGKVYDAKRDGTYFRIVDPKSEQKLDFVLYDKDAENIAFMARTKETLFDTLRERYKDRE